MPTPPDRYQEELPQVLKESKLNPEDSRSFCSQIQSIISQVGIKTKVRDFSKKGEDAQTSVEADEANRIYEPLTKLTDPQLHSLLALIYKRQNSMLPDDEIVIGQLPGIDTEITVYTPNRNSKGTLLGSGQIKIDSQGTVKW